MLKNKIYKGVLITVLTVGTMVVVPSMAQVYASDSTTTQTQSILSRIMSRFNLNKDDVQDFVTQHRAERQSLNQDRMVKRLDDAVKAGVINEAQKQAILEKTNAFRNKVRNTDILSMNPQERRAKMQSHREDMRKWAEENGIDVNSLLLRNGGGFRSGNGSGMKGPKGVREGFENGLRNGQGNGMFRNFQAN